MLFFWLPLVLCVRKQRCKHKASFLFFVSRKRSEGFSFSVPQRPVPRHAMSFRRDRSRTSEAPRTTGVAAAGRTIHGRSPPTGTAARPTRVGVTATATTTGDTTTVEEVATTIVFHMASDRRTAVAPPTGIGNPTARGSSYGERSSYND